MKTRVISGLVGAALLIAVLVQPFTLIVEIGVAALCVIAVYELLIATKLAPSKLVCAVCMVFAAGAPFWRYLPQEALLWVAYGFGTLLVVAQVTQHKDQPATATLYAAAVTLLSSKALSSIAFLRADSEFGLFAVVWMLLIPWMSDTGAYFTGVLCGKTKLCPEISPKKTVEGLIGGLFTSVIICLAVAYVYETWIYPEVVVNYYAMAAVTLLGAALSVFGDLLASLIKRHAGIKDFGNLMPGHGGVMDRFDSLLLTAPLVVLSLMQWPIICVINS